MLDWDDRDVERMVLDEIRAGIDVYYDREWPLTRRFCRFLLDHPEWVAGRDALVVGAGVGMEAVVVGRLARSLRINDLAPVALELQRRQLDANDIEVADAYRCSFAEVPLAPEVDLVVGCFVVYDRDTGEAMERLLQRTAEEGVPVLLADQDIGGHFTRAVEAAGRRPQPLFDGAQDRILWIE